MGDHWGTIAVFAKVAAAIVGSFVLSGFFVRFVYHVFVEYFRSIDKVLSAIYGPEGEPQKGIEHRLTVLETEHDLKTCKKGRKK